MTTDIGINSTDFTRKKDAKSAPPEQAGPKSTYLPPASCCVKTFCYPFVKATLLFGKTLRLTESMSGSVGHFALTTPLGPRSEAGSITKLNYPILSDSTSFEP